MGIIFSSFNGLEPRLRFNEFIENWERYEAEEIFQNITDKNHPDDIVLTIQQGKGTLPRELSGRNILYDNTNTKNYKRVKFGDFIIHLRSFEGGLEIANEQGIVSPAYTILRHKKNIAFGFYKAYFRTNEFINHVLSKSVEGIRDGKQISYDAFKWLSIPYCKLEEQQKIADFLSLVDQRIEKQRQLVESLKKYKRGLLSVIFDRKIRFKDKNANTFPEWQNTTLSDIGNFYNGLSGKNKDDFITGNSEYVTYMNVFKNTIADENICERVNVSEFEHQNIVQYGDILFTQSSETMEEVGFSSVWISSKTPFLNSFCFGLRLKNLSFVYPQFMGYLLRSYKLRILIMRESQGATRINLSSERLKNIKFMLPCFDEQVVIADLIMKIDDYIAICEEKYSYLAKLKNGLLQQMFI